MPRTGVDAELVVVREALGYILKWNESKNREHRDMVSNEVLPALFDALPPETWVQGHANALDAEPAGQAARTCVLSLTRGGGPALAAVASGLDSGEPFSSAAGLGAVLELAKRVGARCKGTAGNLRGGVTDANLREVALSVAASLSPHATGMCACMRDLHVATPACRVLLPAACSTPNSER